MLPCLLLLINLVVSLHGLGISPGKYSRLWDLDYFNLTVSAGSKVEITYHHHLIQVEKCEFLPNGELVQFELPWDHIGRLRGAQPSELASVIKVFNSTHLTEAQGNKVRLWERVANEVAENKLVEIAMIQKPNTHNTAFIHKAFTLSPMPSVYYWDGIYGVSECPTTEVMFKDKYHDASKIIGITLAHFRIWQEFYRRYRDGDQRQRILILESDIHCHREFCGDIALEYINNTNKDILFIGWFYMDRHHGNKPPLCSHAYSISVAAAKILIDNVFPCSLPVDDQIARACERGILTWDTAGAKEDQRLGQTAGLIRQNKW